MFKDKFFRNSIVLTLTNSTTGILKFIFSIILSRKLGAEGMGLYALIMPIYDVFACLVCGGMVTAISKQSSAFLSKNDNRNLHKTIKITLIFDFLWSLIIVILLFLNTKYISSNIIKDSRSLYSLWFISLALIFVALSSIIKGYFYGTYNVKTPAIIDIFEKTTRIISVVIIINYFSLSGIENTVSAVYGALACGELLSFLLLYIFYKIDRNKKNKPTQISTEKEGNAQLLFDVLIMSVPLCINGFLSTAISTVSTLIIPIRLTKAGFDHGVALGMIGKFSGMALTIIYFPIIVIMSMAMVLIPDISESLTKRDYYTLEKRIKQVISISFLLGLATMVICLSIPNELGYLFYNRLDLGYYIKFASISAPFTFVAATTYSILNGLGKQSVLLKNSLITSVEELILLFLLTSIPQINIMGYGISLLITSLTSLVLNLYEIKKKIYIDFKPTRIFTSFLISILIYLLINITNVLFSTNFFKFKVIFMIFAGFILFFYLNSLFYSKEE
ncbi:stage V sporulation protein B [Clostridium sp. DL1XJH146]